MGSMVGSNTRNAVNEMKWNEMLYLSLSTDCSPHFPLRTLISRGSLTHPSQLYIEKQESFSSNATRSPTTRGSFPATWLSKKPSTSNWHPASRAPAERPARPRPLSSMVDRLSCAMTRIIPRFCDDSLSPFSFSFTLMTALFVSETLPIFFFIFDCHCTCRVHFLHSTTTHLWVCLHTLPTLAPLSH